MQTEPIFPSLTEDARLWIYATDRDLSQTERSNILDSLNAFINSWLSHGRKVHAEAALLHHRFVVIAAQIPESEISGCGIDASVHAVEAIGAEVGFSLLSGLNIMYRDEAKKVQHASRSEFRKAVRAGVIHGETVVFDTSLTRLGSLREHQFEMHARDAWHATVFRIPVSTP